MTGIGEVEIFRIFVEMQPVLGIQILMIVLFSTVAAIGMFYLGYKLAVKHDWGCDSKERVYMAFLFGLAGMVIMWLLSSSIANVFMRISYPEYYAAKSLLYELGLLTP